jgi:2-methylisocitrate lyase-like PEP mutase family enzyme
MHGPRQIKGKSRFARSTQRDRAFVIPNPWDVGTGTVTRVPRIRGARDDQRRLSLSPSACPTTRSAGRGVLTHVEEIVAAPTFPSARTSRTALATTRRLSRQTIQLAAGMGLAGGSIEDSTERPKDPIYEFRTRRRQDSCRRRGRAVVILRVHADGAL